MLPKFGSHTAENVPRNSESVIWESACYYYSVAEVIAPGGAGCCVDHPEVMVYKHNQALPQYVITYAASPYKIMLVKYWDEFSNLA